MLSRIAASIAVQITLALRGLDSEPDKDAENLLDLTFADGQIVDSLMIRSILVLRRAAQCTTIGG